jgi:4-hydroxy-3-polyprenylbenzoate decarboxylase
VNPQPTSGSKLGIDATKKLPGEGFKRPWLPLITMDAPVKAKVESFSTGSSLQS